MSPGPAGRFTGIAREPVYSPGKVEADRAILEDTAKALAGRGASVRLLEAEQVDEAATDTDLVFAMCQGPTALAGLRRLESAGLPLVHTAAAMEACHRVRMLGLLEAAGIPRPASRLVRTGPPDAQTRAFVLARGEAGVWVKRGDVHATEEADVRHVAGAADAAAALEALAARGVASAVLEAHVPGATIKFYGVAGQGFFRAFEGDRRDPTPHPPAWARLAETAARALGLGVYGGDLIVDLSGSCWVVDVNDWPSFSRCRRDAAEAIAQYLLARLREARGA